MNGTVDDFGRALVPIRIGCRPGEPGAAIDAWGDTGFTGDLVIANAVVETLNLEESGSVDAVLADGSLIELPTYTCFIDWFGSKRRLEVVANDGEYALLGVGLLIGLELKANYATHELTLMKG